MVEGVMSLHVWLSHNQNDQMMTESLLIQRQSEEISLNKMPPPLPVSQSIAPWWRDEQWSHIKSSSLPLMCLIILNNIT